MLTLCSMVSHLCGGQGSAEDQTQTVLGPLLRSSSSSPQPMLTDQKLSLQLEFSLQYDRALNKEHTMVMFSKPSDFLGNY